MSQFIHHHLQQAKRLIWNSIIIYDIYHNLYILHHSSIHNVKMLKIMHCEDWWTRSEVGTLQTWEWVVDVDPRDLDEHILWDGYFKVIRRWVCCAADTKVEDGCVSAYRSGTTSRVPDTWRADRYTIRRVWDFLLHVTWMIMLQLLLLK